MAQVLKEAMAFLQKNSEDMSVTGVLEQVVTSFPGAVTFSTSFSYEDQVITDLIHKSNAGISIFTLDTGRQFNETYSTWSRTIEKYGLKITAFYPDETELKEFVSQKGPNAFYESVENRKSCCYIRKVVPLKKALEGKAVWVTGLRAQHSPDRNNLQAFEWDESNQILKYHPLLHWSTEEVRAYIDENNVPYNSLHDKGFVSIGCAPCTRAIKPGEDFRAGRWWWEDASKKECGLHVHQTTTLSN
ncbi:MAG: phosphoadenylyl-sulfate reductase [Flavisolibacter sp.]|jgi:phosphoadenosine phosphosulfate reductase|nr:phosphoadenylyl-sulfate reductase [Flavisolibacter sp.]